MDAKPIRGFRVHGDENAIPDVLTKKTIHSRNKSSPALSTMAAAGPMKLPAKRTAFGDVSNTARGNHLVQDHAAPTGKQHIQLQVEKRNNTTSQHPAQRPISLATGIKGFVGSSVASTRALFESSQPTSSSTSNLHRALSKKNTTVFKDYSTLSKPLEDQLNIQDNVAVREPLVPLNKNLPQPSNSSSILTKVDEPEKVRKTKSIQSIKSAKTDSAAQSSTTATRSSVSTLSSAALVNTSSVNHIQMVDVLNKASQSQGLSLRKTPLPRVTTVEQPSKASLRKNNSLAEVVVTKHQGSELEEYWDEDYEEEENYDDDGYVTARSSRSKADNLTGNVTTTVIPKTGSKVRKELEAAAAIVSLSRPLTELEDEAWDVTMVSEYKEEIFEYFRELEVKMAPNPHYMDFQTEIQWSMRSVLMDWVVQVHHRFQLLPETLFLCANLIDRFLSCKVVSLGKLQLVGATAIFIASKYEEINCPSVGEIVYMVDNGYTVDEVLKAERFMLTLLQFDLGWPGPMSFLRRISTADDYDLETRTLAKYFLEITVMDERFLGCPPSFTAAGAHCLARSMLKKGHWTTAHVHYSGYTYSQLLPILELMLDCLHDPAKHHGAIYDKYMDKRFKCASQFVKNEIYRGYRIASVAANDRQTYRALSLEPLSLREYTNRGLLEYTFSVQVPLPPQYSLFSDLLA